MNYVICNRNLMFISIYIYIYIYYFARGRILWLKCQMCALWTLVKIFVSDIRY
jgi:hypothetical protein